MKISPKGTFKNYVDHFSLYFDHLPTSGWHFYYIGFFSNVDILRTTYLPRLVNVVFEYSNAPILEKWDRKHLKNTYPLNSSDLFWANTPKKDRFSIIWDNQLVKQLFHHHTVFCQRKKRELRWLIVDNNQLIITALNIFSFRIHHT